MNILKSTCSGCERFNFCSETRKFVVTHRMKLEVQISFQLIGLREFYGDTIVDKALAFLSRVRRWFKYKYVFRVGDVSIYLRKVDVLEKEDIFVFNEATKFFEFDSKNKLSF